MSDNHPPTRGRNTYIGKSDPAEFPDRYSLFELRPDGSGTYVELSQNEDADSAEDIVQETCFVLMPFRDPFVGYYEDIYVQAIKASGLQPVQAGEITKPGAISNQIWQGINNASVCLAELTGQNPNVMYELGLAHAVGKPVVSLVQSMDDIPFDLRHLRHIVYDTSAVRWDEALRTKIEAMLQATIADPHQSLAFPDIGTSQPRRRPPAITAIGQAPSVGSFGERENIVR